jgi:hypothetical protein
MTTSDRDQQRLERRIQEAQLVADSVIDGKLLAHYSEKFRLHYPKNIEHSLRMCQEQLQTGLKNRTLSTLEIAELSASVYYLNEVYRQL